MWETLKDLEPSFAEAVKQGYLGTAKYPPGASKEMIQALDSLSKQAINDFNLVNSNMLNSSLDAYRKIVANTVTMANFAEAQAILNSAAGGVVMGVASCQKALADAIKKMADNGITGFYDKAGKEWPPEAYINMTVRTTMTSTAREATGYVEYVGTQITAASGNKIVVVEANANGIISRATAKLDVVLGA